MDGSQLSLPEEQLPGAEAQCSESSGTDTAGQGVLWIIVHPYLLSSGVDRPNMAYCAHEDQAITLRDIFACRVGDIPCPPKLLTFTFAVSYESSSKVASIGACDCQDIEGVVRHCRGCHRSRKR